MKILSFTAQKPNSTGSGVYLTELVKTFHDLGHEQMVIAGVYEEDVIDFPKGVKFLPVCYKTEKLPFSICGMSDEMPYESTRYSDMTEQMTEQLVEAFSERILQAKKGFEPDMILCHHLYFVSGLVRELCKDVPVFGICHGSDLRQVKKNPWRREYIMEQNKKFDHIFALHKAQKHEIMNLFDMDENKVSVIGTGYNNSVFYQGNVTGNQRKGKLLFAGKVSEKKGVKSLLRSCVRLNEAESLSLTLAGGSGDERERQEIEDLAKEVSFPVEFAGRIPQNELADRMRSSEVFVLPSFYEGLPLVVIEALACGMKVVCTALPGVEEWLDAQLENPGVHFVEPPRMKNEDEPMEEDLCDFEQRLAQAMEQALSTPYAEPKGLAQITWGGVCSGILAVR